jgi:hypothetical protein
MAVNGSILVGTDWRAFRVRWSPFWAIFYSAAAGTSFGDLNVLYEFKETP